MNENDYSTPKYLLKAGMAAIEAGQYGEAVTLLSRLKDNYPNAAEYQQAEIFLGQAEAMQ